MVDPGSDFCSASAECESNSNFFMALRKASRDFAYSDGNLGAIDLLALPLRLVTPIGITSSGSLSAASRILSIRSS